MSGPAAWEDNDTIARAIEIRDGAVINKDVLEFQHRAADYPHEALPES
jgi:hypothetical protein